MTIFVSHALYALRCYLEIQVIVTLRGSNIVVLSKVNTTICGLIRYWRYSATKLSMANIC